MNIHANFALILTLARVKVKSRMSRAAGTTAQLLESESSTQPTQADDV